MASVSRPVRILHCPTNQTGHAYQLSLRERERGFDSRLVTLTPEPFGFPVDRVLSSGSAAGREIARFRLLSEAARWADVVHLNYGSPILRQWTGSSLGSSIPRRAVAALDRVTSMRELAFLRRLGKRIVVTYEGSDCRLSACADQARDSTSASVLRTEYPFEADPPKVRKIQQFSRLAHSSFVVTPDLLNFVQGQYVPVASVDVASLGRRRPRPSADLGPIVVGHAPSNRDIKGTRFIVQAVDRLRSEGVAVDLRLIEGVTHQQALEAMESVDVVVDQLIVGWYGAVAVEAMALSKPVVCNLHPAALARAGALGESVPIVDSTPETVARTIRQIVERGRTWLHARGAEGREFACQWHDPARIADIVAAAYVN